MKLSSSMKKALDQFSLDEYRQQPTLSPVRSNTLLALEKKGLIEKKPNEAWWRWATDQEWKLTEVGSELVSKGPEKD